MSDRYRVALYLKYRNSTMNSPLIQAEMQGWEIDSIISIGMAAAFFLPTVLPFPWIQALVPYWIYFNDYFVYDHAAYANQDGNFGNPRFTIDFSGRRNHSRDPAEVSGAWNSRDDY